MTVRLDVARAHRIDDPTAAEVALASAWHREACGLRGLATRQCKFWQYHLYSARRVLADLAEQGVVISVAPVTPSRRRILEREL